MALPPLPAETALRPGESILGRWNFEHDVKQSFIGHITALALLTNQRLILLELPTSSAAYRATRWMSRERAKLADQLGKWYVLLIAELRDIPEPVLGTQITPTAIVSGPRVLSVAGKNFPVGSDPRADEMLQSIRAQWANARSGTAQS
jgi:hypothetical protein